jgi:transposase
VIGAALEAARAHPGAIALVFQDEASFYRQPTQAALWAGTGRRQPHLSWSHRKNILVRVAGTLDAVSGQTCFREAPRFTVDELLRFYRQVLAQYAARTLIYLVQDNWPVHFQARVEAFLQQHPQLQVLRLPTYAPRLNPVEKAWKWARQHLTHAHPYSDDFAEFRGQLTGCLAEIGAQPHEIRHYCGLDNLTIYS